MNTLGAKRKAQYNEWKRQYQSKLKGEILNRGKSTAPQLRSPKLETQFIKQHPGNQEVKHA